MTAALRTALGVPFRQLSGMADKMLEGHDSPHHTTLCRRMEKFDISIHGNTIHVHDASRHVTLMADATGLRQWNRGEWIRDKWKAVVLRKGYVKMHLLADADTGMILAAVVTDDRTGDSPVPQDLLDQAVAEPFAKAGKDDARKRPNMLADGVSPLAGSAGGKEEEEEEEVPSASLLADGAYASKKNMNACRKKGIKPLVPLKPCFAESGRGDDGKEWNLAVKEQLGGSADMHVKGLTVEQKKENRRYWKSTVGYDKRWRIEVIISAFKRMFGEHLFSRKWESMVREVRMRIAMYNRWVAATM